MADVQTEIEKISSAVYGEEVRGAMVNSLTKINATQESISKDVGSKQSTTNMYSTKQNLTDKESSYPSIKYLENYYYDMDDVDTELDKKAGLDAYENVVGLSITISTADQLNDYTDINKTYTFYAVPPLTTDLASGAGTYFMLNNYSGGSIQIVRPVKDINKAFIREYSSTSHTWSDFKEITIPDKSVTKEKLSADLRTELAGKYDASNVEYGSGTLTGGSGYENETATFNYQKVGNLVTVIGKATFSGENTTLVRLVGLPYMPTSETMFLYTQHYSSKSKWMMVNTNYSVLEVRPSTSGQVFEANETLRFAISYYTA